MVRTVATKATAVIESGIDDCGGGVGHRVHHASRIHGQIPRGAATHRMPAVPIVLGAYRTPAPVPMRNDRKPILLNFPRGLRKQLHVFLRGRILLRRHDVKKVFGASCKIPKEKHIAGHMDCASVYVSYYQHCLGDVLPQAIPPGFSLSSRGFFIVLLIHIGDNHRLTQYHTLSTTA